MKMCVFFVIITIICLCLIAILPVCLLCHSVILGCLEWELAI